ncbi:hypothetical protein HK102_001750 [Quaeritorhiza haematococci]|nr:hypothetical protein HK102_001750 [Quaeritorhiza haematococci]
MIVEVLNEKEGTKMVETRWIELWGYSRDSPIDVDSKFVQEAHAKLYVDGIRALGLLALWRVKVLGWIHPTFEEVRTVARGSLWQINVLLGSYKRLQQVTRIRVNNREARAPKGWMNRLSRTTPDEDVESPNDFEICFSKISDLVVGQSKTEAADEEEWKGADGTDRETIGKGPRARELESVSNLRQTLKVNELSPRAKPILVNLLVDALRNLDVNISEEEKAKIRDTLKPSETKKVALCLTLSGILVALPEPILTNAAAAALAGAAWTGAVGSNVQKAWARNVGAPKNINEWMKQHQAIVEASGKRPGMISEEKELTFLYWTMLGLLSVHSCFHGSNPIHYRFVVGTDMQDRAPPAYSETVNNNNVIETREPDSKRDCFTYYLQTTFTGIMNKRKMVVDCSLRRGILHLRGRRDSDSSTTGTFNDRMIALTEGVFVALGRKDRSQSSFVVVEIHVGDQLEEYWLKAKSAEMAKEWVDALRYS